MDDRDLELLEFHKIREIIAGFTSFSASRELALKLCPLVDEQQVRHLLSQSAEARRLLSLGPDFHLGEVTDIRETVKMATRGKVLEPQTLLAIEKTLDAVNQLRDNLTGLFDKLPLLGELARDIVDLRQLQKRIGDSISPSGDVLDSASPRLAAVRREGREVRQRLLSRLEAIIQSPRGQKVIQEPIIAEREGRYVILVRAESRRELKGIVHDVSNSGATLYIEPWATVDISNHLRELVMEEKHEVERILEGLSLEAGAYQAEISRNIELAAEIDLALAKARYAYRIKAAEPVIIAAGEYTEGAVQEQDFVLRLVEARHPLLGAKAVPLSVEIGRDFTALIITGPNTGGKTVALKTIGLLSLMAQAGLPIPASTESHIPLFDSVFADIGDEQSIEQTLSTFSWHVSNIVRIINGTTNRSLVLLDELGTNTDPGEGSALARSILIYFLSLRTMTVATTHYTELKAFAHATDGMQNASLDIDPVTMLPTYHLTLGIPGGSNALVTASRLGLLHEIVDRARAMLSRGTQELETLLSDLTYEQKSVEALHHTLEEARGQVEQKNAELDKRLRQLESEERKIIRDTSERVSREAAELHREIRKVTSELRKEKSRERIEQAKKALTSVREQLEGETWDIKAVENISEVASEAGPIVAGDNVWLKEAGLEATVLSASEETGQVEVQAGSVKMVLSMDSVEKIPSSGSLKPERSRIMKVQSKRAVSLELDLRGKRADEVEPILDSYLNEASLAGMSEVWIIHGIGTGTVRQIVREFLASHLLVKSFRPGGRSEGGDGATIVRL